MATYNNYDKLYENMKNRLTVVDENSEYTLGEYMTMKADNRKTNSNLPIASRSNSGRGERAVAMLVSYVNDKLTIKEAPVKDKTIRAFPFRASMSALLSAAVACTFIFTIGIIGSRALGSNSANGNDMIVVENEETVENEATVCVNQ